jgi:hypothetical protein
MTILTMAEYGIQHRRIFTRLAEFQSRFGSPITDVAVEAPERALYSLREAAASAPSEYADYLNESIACYEGGQYRAAVLMLWAATVQHLYMVAGRVPNGISKFEQANSNRYGGARNYRPIKKADDFLYMREADFIQLAEDAGMINRNARKLLIERLDLRNRCGHPTQYRPGREEVVIFIESLLLNVIDGAQINW